jgi:hypothetical protein
LFRKKTRLKVKQIGKILMMLVNFVIAAGWLWAFHSLGWITFTAEMPLWQTVLLTALVALLVQTVAGWFYALFIMATCFLGCITLPVFLIAQGWVILWGVERLTHWYSIEVEFWWLGLLMSVAFGLIRIPDVSVSTSSTEA